MYSSVWLTVCLSVEYFFWWNDLFTACSTYWLTDWLTDYLTDWLIGWPLKSHRWDSLRSTGQLLPAHRIMLEWKRRKRWAAYDPPYILLYSVLYCSDLIYISMWMIALTVDTFHFLSLSLHPYPSFYLPSVVTCDSDALLLSIILSHFHSLSLSLSHLLILSPSPSFSLFLSVCLSLSLSLTVSITLPHSFFLPLLSGAGLQAPSDELHNYLRASRPIWNGCWEELLVLQMWSQQTSLRG